MIKEAIILAGGLGTRLRDTVPDLPKCMVPVNGKPFLFFVINHLCSQGIERFVFSLGYKYEYIEDYLASRFSTLNYETVIEQEPLGTGGAIQLALTKITGENCIITNGDTLFLVSVEETIRFHIQQGADCTLFLKLMLDFDRYGVVEVNKEKRIVNFKEKKFYTKGTINAGTYILNRKIFLDRGFPEKFSFEKEYLEKYFPEGKMYGWEQNSYFIDIGIPQDYFQVQYDLKQSIPDLKKLDRNWTIFLDRDGVINYEKKDEYIKNVNEFRFFDGVKEAVCQLSNKFGNIIIVSNQRGVGKGLMTDKDLADIHAHMTSAIEAAGGRIDKIYYCSSTDDKHPDRKPNPGMAFKAARENNKIDLGRSIMVGNKLSDMSFGKNAGMFTVFAATTNPEIPFPHPDIDFRFNSLRDFVKAL